MTSSKLLMDQVSKEFGDGDTSVKVLDNISLDIKGGNLSRWSDLPVRAKALFSPLQGHCYPLPGDEYGWAIRRSPGSPPNK